MRAALLLALALAATPAVAADKPAPMLSVADLDPAQVLPPPPALGSVQAKAEFAELHAIEMVRTPADEADARLDGETKNASVFAGVLGPRFDLATLPATARLMAIVRATEKDVVDRGKAHFRRARPYAVEPALKSCKAGGDPGSSYPSGHTSMAFAMGETLARLVPAKAEGLLGRAARYGQSRIVCEQHFRSDVSAGQALGTLIAERLMDKAAFRSAFDESKRELVRVGIAAPIR
jgi:hypothetical protein